MAPVDYDQVSKHLADLRLQVNALTIAAKDASLSHMLAQTRRTMHIATVVIALALVSSASIKACSDARVDSFEHRLDVLERAK